VISNIRNDRTSGMWGGFAVQWRDLEGDFVLVTVIPEVVLDGEFRPHLSHSQEIAVRGLCPEIRPSW
jgi:hypothetical protein